MPKYFKRAVKKKSRYTAKKKKMAPTVTYRRHRRPRRTSTYGMGGTKLIYLKSRCVEVLPINPVTSVNAAFQRCRFAIPWGRPVSGGFPDANVQSVSGTPVFMRQQSVYTTARFLLVKNNWKEYAVTGLRIEFIPQPITPTTNDGNPWVNRMSYNVGMTRMEEDGLNALSQELFEDTGFKMLDPNRRWKKYISMK